ncbi:TPA: glycosyltransferase family 4 protein [Escherichia coli]|uniref:glycosyltransferase n=1 Tax=Escherichia coli TaxID=562 RepID=UPI000BB64B56|nr:glycosyltransferase [Escherichia coli]EET4508883.1 glycosyltransferase family 4 protein [Escherichia coli]EMC3695129.1 glycosyltransferase [Escherichia coli]EMC5057728.1 glycosyltransferase [Escherichia coli]EMC7746877.1 glycosyltransferase [Escherichia coli]EMD1091613.1 glycosyltransferase [Escherichia coli]
MIVKMWPLQKESTANQYTSLILHDVIEYKPHKWNLKNMLDMRFDIFHMHWPETYLNLPKRYQQLIGTLCVVLFLVVCKLFSKKIVWTVHNFKPHENHNNIKISEFFRTFLVRMVDKFIFLTEVSKDEFLKIYNIDNSRLTVIHHPLYQVNECCHDISAANHSSINNKYLFFGLIRPYKNIELLMNEFIKYDSDSVLIIMGGCSNTLATELRNMKKKIDFKERIKFKFGYYNEQQLQQELNQCKGVIIPYSDIMNSGVLYRAITAGVNVLLPRIRYTEEVVNSLKYQGAVFYDPPLDTNDIATFNGIPSVNHNNFDVDTYNTYIKNAHYELYQTII